MHEVGVVLKRNNPKSLGKELPYVFNQPSMHVNIDHSFGEMGIQGFLDFGDTYWFYGYFCPNILNLIFCQVLQTPLVIIMIMYLSLVMTKCVFESLRPVNTN